MFIDIICLVLAYLIGSISTAILVCKAFDLPDPRAEGSQNAGATNVLRMGDKKMAAMVLVGDALKGLVAVLIARIFGLDGFTLGLVAAAVVAGHIFPAFFNFKGGKGVATTLGALLAMDWIVAIVAIAVWLIVAKLYKYSSLASLCGVATGVLLMLVFMPGAFLSLLIVAALVAYKHYDNIQRLISGTESKIDFM